MVSCETSQWLPDCQEIRSLENFNFTFWCRDSEKPMSELRFAGQSGSARIYSRRERLYLIIASLQQITRILHEFLPSLLFSSKFNANEWDRIEMVCLQPQRYQVQQSQATKQSCCNLKCPKIWEYCFVGWSRHKECGGIQVYALHFEYAWRL